MTHSLTAERLVGASPYHPPEAPETIGIATATRYPSWQPNKVTPEGIRGNLALKMTLSAIDVGHSVVVVDGGSSDEFLTRLVSTGAIVQTEQEASMSGARRQALTTLAGLPGIAILGWGEPEKTSIPACIPEIVEPIREKGARLVVPKRGIESFATYPDYQVHHEVMSNATFDRILREADLWNDPSKLDTWIGPRFFPNDPAMLELFMDKYTYTDPESQQHPLKNNLELWPNALFLPVIAALHKGYRVAAPRIPYQHPFEQTASERDSEALRGKRAFQEDLILDASRRFIRYLNGDPSAGIASFSSHS